MSDPSGRPDRPTPGHGAELMSTPHLFALAVLAFAVELALFCGVGAIAYELAGGGLRGWLAAAAATAAVLVFWGLLVAPKARRRLATGPRLLVTALLCLGTASGLILLGHPWWGWFVGVAGIAVVAAQVVLPSTEPDPR